jgi:hypothetical protein
MLKNFFTFSRFTLFVALCISAIAAWYSVIGLTAIFAGAVIPIIVMGSILEIAKITTTVWLHKYWDRASWSIRAYLTGAVVALALLTSMGVFGLLSKAHIEQGVTGGDVVAQVALLDEKIKTQRDNIDVARKALAQMDAQVDQRLARGDSESGAERAVQIRRQQAGERSKLQAEIQVAQKEITKLNEQRAPIASQLRKVEAEVGPIKYIASIIYGDNPDSTTLERAVRWVTILIVLVFDPLAIILILAANNSMKWEEEDRLKANQVSATPKSDVPLDMTHMTPWPRVWDDRIEDSEEPKYSKPPTPDPIPETLPVIQEEVIVPPAVPAVEKIEEPKSAPNYSQSSYTTKYTLSDPVIQLQSTNTPVDVESPDDNIQKEEVVEVSDSVAVEPEVEIQTEGVTKQVQIFSDEESYVTYDGKKMSMDALKGLQPNLVVRGPIVNDILFGSKFPSAAKTGDIYIRIDVVPHKVFKFNGIRWILVDKNENYSYLHNLSYIQYLISKIDSGEYSLDLLTGIEHDEISAYLKNTV